MDNAEEAKAMPKKQKCTISGCEKDSVPGLRTGHGKCQYHWNAGVWGKKWADECEQREEVARRVVALGDLKDQRNDRYK